MIPDQHHRDLLHDQTQAKLISTESFPAIKTEKSIMKPGVVARALPLVVRMALRVVEGT